MSEMHSPLGTCVAAIRRRRVRAAATHRRRALALAVLVLVLVLASFPWEAPSTSLAQRAPSAPQAAISGLHRVGNQIQNGNGQVVRLRGVDIPSGEYACIFDFGIFVNPTDQAAVNALLDWKINVVRIPLNEDCWLDVMMAGIDPAYRGANYRNAVIAFVNLLTQNGIAVIVDLHWAAPNGYQATYQRPMPNRNNSIAFWTSVATTFKTNTGVIFDLYNEPYPDNNQDTAAAWTCLRDGSPIGGPTASCPGPDEQGNPNYAAAGMQELLNAVRNAPASATNLVLVAGVAYTGRLKDWVAYKPNDPLNNLAASIHIYPPGSQCSNQACWDVEVAPVAAQYPLIAGEIGQDSCGVDRINPVIDWLEGKQQHFLVWAWWVVPCAPGNPTYGLLTNYNGSPTAGYGQGYKDRLAALVNAQPSFTTSASVLPATVAPGGTVAINASVTSATAFTGVVVIYEYDPGGNFYDQQYFTGQTFTAGQTRSYPVTWPVPAGAPNGAWTVRIGVFEQTFTDLLYWNGNAAQITVAPTNVPCTPRPNVGLSVVPTGAGTVRVTVSAQTNASTPANSLSAIQFNTTATSHALISIPNGVQNSTSPPPVNPVNPQPFVFFVRPQTPGSYVTVPLMVTDGCGPWNTFVGGGPSAFPGGDAALASPTPTPSLASPSATPQPAPVSPTPAPASVVCSPRPSIAVSSTSGGGGRLQVTLTAPSGLTLQVLRLGALDNAVVDVGSQLGLGSGASVPLAAGTTQAVLTVRRVTAGQASTVPLTVVDSCGDWPTVVGGGPAAF